MRVSSTLVRGDGSAIASHIGSMSSNAALNVLVLMSLGADHTALLNAVKEASIQCPVYLTETYGVIGYDVEAQRHVELMEKGRGSEYGFKGGSGGQGCLVIAYSEGAVAGHTAEFPSDASSLLVVADGSKSFARVADRAPLHYGGITKEAFVRRDDGTLEPVPFFWVASPTKSEPTGVATFTEDAGGAASSLLTKVPQGWKPASVGLFPCFTRGVNLYDAEDVESTAIGTALQGEASGARIYGMFAHGELGPSDFAGFTSEATAVPHEQHSMTSILTVHTRPADEKDEV